MKKAKCIFCKQVNIFNIACRAFNIFLSLNMNDVRIKFFAIIILFSIFIYKRSLEYQQPQQK